MHKFYHILCIIVNICTVIVHIHLIYAQNGLSKAL